MREMILAFERTCDKRHQRMINSGKPENEAAQIIVKLINDYRDQHGKYFTQQETEYLESLLVAYTIPLEEEI